jgi:hypothetical protein
MGRGVYLLIATNDFPAWGVVDYGQVCTYSMVSVSGWAVVG